MKCITLFRVVSVMTEKSSHFFLKNLLILALAFLWLLGSLSILLEVLYWRLIFLNQQSVIVHMAQLPMKMLTLINSTSTILYT